MKRYVPGLHGARQNADTDLAHANASLLRHRSNPKTRKANPCAADPPTSGRSRVTHVFRRTGASIDFPNSRLI